MRHFFQIISKILVVLYLIILHILAIGFIYEKCFAPLFRFEEIKNGNVEIPTEPTVLPTIPPYPADDSNSSSNQNINRNVLTPEFVGRLMIPVVGITREQLQDNFSDERSDEQLEKRSEEHSDVRSEERIHNALDIPAPLGTSVVAASDGEIAKFYDSERGGITIYQYSPDQRYIYYYAHLQKRAENIKEGDFVKQGTLIGYVGDTGNAGEGNYHLHFSVSILDDPKRYFEGRSINPFPLLKNGVEAPK